MALGIPEVRGILPRGGTILGSSRTNPFKVDGGVDDQIAENLHALGVDALIAIGGEDTLGVATKLHELGVNVVGVPKTIDNDLNATDYTFGFDTAVNIAMEAIDRLHTTAESHHRALVVEVMGRHAGWIALHAGIAGGANVILIPEVPFSVDRVCAYVEKPVPVALRADPGRRRGCYARRRRGCTRRPGSSTPSGMSGSPAGSATGWPRDRAQTGKRGPHHRARPHPARRHADSLRPRARHPIRAACDRRGPSGDWGKMVALSGTDIVRVPLADADRNSRPSHRSSTPRPRCSSADVIRVRRPGRDDLI